jgi:hypothetical protein
MTSVMTAIDMVNITIALIIRLVVFLEVDSVFSSVSEISSNRVETMAFIPRVNRNPERMTPTSSVTTVTIYTKSLGGSGILLSLLMGLHR